MAQPAITIRNVDGLLRQLDQKYGRRAMERKSSEALAAAGKAVVIPIIASETPDGAQRTDYPPPWRRGRAVPRPGPMKKRIHLKRLKPRGDVAGIHISHRVTYGAAVIRGSIPHDEPGNRLYDRARTGNIHPGARANDIMGRATRRARGPFIPLVKQELQRRI